jgi:serine/threonine protein kinase
LKYNRNELPYNTVFHYFSDKLIETLAQGGFSTVVKVEDVRTRRCYALKILTTDRSKSDAGGYEIEMLEHLSAYDDEKGK